MDRRFTCVACGKCCYGWLPLTLADALARADRFPLTLVWTPVRQGARSFALASKLGPTIRLPDRRSCAVVIAVNAYIPPSLPCPELGEDGKCAIHDDKPLRCRTMPFYPWREENDQGELLIPRKGWICDTGPTAAPVYRDRKILGRADFDRERKELLKQAPLLTAFGETLLAAVPSLMAQMVKAAMRPMGGTVLVDFATLLPRLKDVDAADFARRQHPVLTEWAARTAAAPDLAEHHRYYTAWAEALARYLPKA